MSDMIRFPKPCVAKRFLGYYRADKVDVWRKKVKQELEKIKHGRYDNIDWDMQQIYARKDLAREVLGMLEHGN